MSSMSSSSMDSAQRKPSEDEKMDRPALTNVEVNRALPGGRKAQPLTEQEKKRHPMYRKPSRIRREDSDASYMANSKKRQVFQDNADDDEPTGKDQESRNKRAKVQDRQIKWVDLDSKEKNNIAMVVEYTNDIFDFLYEREKNTIPMHNYLLDRKSKYHLRPATRAVLVDWLVEVHDKFQCYPETLYLGINIMDRFLSQHKVDINKLQLLAVTSLFIAAKFEEINLPKLSEYAYITDGAASKDDIKVSEMFILTELKFSLDWPNPLNFLRRLSKADGYDGECRMIAKFILEYSLCSSKFVGEKPSELAAMAIFLARRILKRESPIWDDTFIHYSGGIDALNDNHFQNLCTIMINEIAQPATKLTALCDKYKSIKGGTIYDKTIKWCKDQMERNYENVFSC